MEDIIIREARESDLPAVEKLLGELVNTLEDTGGMDIGTALGTCKRLLDDAGSHFLVAEVDGAPVGFINFSVRQTILHRCPSALIDELVVEEAYQGKGAGRKLVLAAIEKCRQLGCCEVEVSTEKANLKAREFYKRCGFEDRGMLFEADL